MKMMMLCRTIGDPVSFYLVVCKQWAKFGYASFDMNHWVCGLCLVYARSRCQQAEAPKFGFLILVETLDCDMKLA